MTRQCRRINQFVLTERYFRVTFLGSCVDRSSIDQDPTSYIAGVRPIITFAGTLTLRSAS